MDCEVIKRNCGTCRHRAYGDQRLISQCALKVLGDPLRTKLRHDGVIFNGNGEIFTKAAAPRARNFGTKCRRWQPQLVGILKPDGSVFYGHADKPTKPDP